MSSVRSAASAGIFHGRPKTWPICSVRVTGLPSSSGATGRIRGPSTAWLRSDCWHHARSRGVQKPIGEIAVALDTSPRRASSSATPAPVEIPATSGRPSPTRDATASVSA